MKAALLCITTTLFVGLCPYLGAQDKSREGNLPRADRVLLRFAFEVAELDRRRDDLPNRYDLFNRTSRTEAAGALLIHLMTVGDEYLPVPGFAKELWKLRMESTRQAAHALREATDSKGARKHWDKATDLLQQSAGLDKAIRDELGKRKLTKVYALFAKRLLRDAGKRPQRARKLAQDAPQWNLKHTRALTLACMELQQQHVFPHWIKVMKQFPDPSCEAAQELYNASKGLNTRVMYAERDLVAKNMHKATRQLDAVMLTYNRLAKEFDLPPRTIDSPAPKLTRRQKNETQDKKPKLQQSAAQAKTTEDSIAEEKTTDTKKPTVDEKATDTKKPTADEKATDTKKPTADGKATGTKKPAAAWSRAKVEALVRTALKVRDLNPRVSDSTLRNLNRLHRNLQKSVRAAADTTSGRSFNRMSRDAKMLLNAYNRAVPREHRVTLEALDN